MATNTAPGLYRRWWPFLTWPDHDPDSWKDSVDAAKDARRKAPNGLILFGNDQHAGALSLADRDVRAARVDNLVKLHHGECRTWELPRKPSLVVCNPPWGLRLMGGSGEGYRRGGAERGEREDFSRGRGDRGDRGSGDGRQSWQREGRERDSYDSRRGYNDGYSQDNVIDDDLVNAWDSLGAFLKRQAGGADAFVLSGSTKATQFLKLRADRRLPLTVGGIDCRLLQYHIRGLQENRNDGAAQEQQQQQQQQSF